LEKLKPTVIGIAGSVGKSSMRAYMTQILSTKYSVLEGDLNTKLGLSTLIVNELDKQKIIVAELGIDRLGEMKQVTDFIKPEFSIITKLEREHLQFLISLDNVIKENMVAISNSKNKEGYINMVDVGMIEEDVMKGIKVYFYPEANFNEEVGQIIHEMELPDHDKEYLMGIYQICRDKFDFSDQQFVETLSLIQKPKGRLNMIPGLKGSLILDDSYNAVADQSIIKGIKFAQALARKYKKKLVVVISPMRETGETEEDQHKNVAEFLNEQPDIELIVIGDADKRYGKYLRIPYKNIISSTYFNYEIKGGELFYAKGSQFYRLEKIVYYLMKDKKSASKILVRQDARWNS